MPRLEYVGRPPAVESALAAAGFTVDRRLPLMSLDPAELTAPPVPAGNGVGVAESDVDLRQVATGATPYLQAEGEPERRIYARIGFREIGELTLASRPSGAH